MAAMHKPVVETQQDHIHASVILVTMVMERLVKVYQILYDLLACFFFLRLRKGEGRVRSISYMKCGGGGCSSLIRNYFEHPCVPVTLKAKLAGGMFDQRAPCNRSMTLLSENTPGSMWTSNCRVSHLIIATIAEIIVTECGLTRLKCSSNPAQTSNRRPPSACCG